jgi:ribosomal protein S19E (S16A)
MTRDDVKKLVAEYVIRIGVNGIPNGHLYAETMDHVDLDTHNAVINSLKEAKLVDQSSHYLTLTEHGRVLFGRIAYAVLATPGKS